MHVARGDSTPWVAGRGTAPGLDASYCGHGCDDNATGSEADELAAPQEELVAGEAAHELEAAQEVVSSIACPPACPSTRGEAGEVRASELAAANGVVLVDRVSDCWRLSRSSSWILSWALSVVLLKAG